MCILLYPSHGPSVLLSLLQKPAEEQVAEGDGDGAADGDGAGDGEEQAAEDDAGDDE